jgi:hypothetical protein
MNEDMKKREKLQSKGERDSNLSKGAETERESGSKRPGTGTVEKVKPDSSSEVSPNTPSGQEL